MNKNPKDPKKSKIYYPRGRKKRLMREKCAGNPPYIPFLLRIVRPIKDLTLHPNHNKKPKMKLVFHSLLVFMAAFSVNLYSENLKEMEYKEALSKYKKIQEIKPFIYTEILEKYPETTNRFFDKAIYQKLKGNDIFGYYHDQGIEFIGNTLSIDTICAIENQYYENHRKTFSNIFQKTLKTHSSHIYIVKKNARFAVGICIVSVKENGDKESPAGLVIESYIKDQKQKKYFFHRFGAGSSISLTQAMRFASALILCDLKYLKNKNHKSNKKWSLNNE